MLYQSSPFCLCSRSRATSTALLSNGSRTVTSSFTVLVIFLPFSNISSVLGTIRLKVAVGGAWFCLAPQVEVTLSLAMEAESYVRAKMVPPRIAQATDAQMKMKTMAIIRLVIMDTPVGSQ